MKKLTTMALIAISTLTFNACQKTNSITQTPTTAQTVKHTRAPQHFYYLEKALPGSADECKIVQVSNMPSSAFTSGYVYGSINNKICYNGVPIEGITGLTYVSDASFFVITSPTSTPYPNRLFRVHSNDVSNAVLGPQLSNITSEFSDIEFLPGTKFAVAIEHSLSASNVQNIPIAKIDLGTGAVTTPYSFNSLLSANGSDYRGMITYQSGTSTMCSFLQVNGSGLETHYEFVLGTASSLTQNTNTDDINSGGTNTDEMGLSMTKIRINI